MVKRSGFYIEDGHICRKDVKIDWDLGFDKAAKWEYIDRIIKVLGDGLNPVVDVTTAAYDNESRSLSPFFVKINGNSVEVQWAELKAQNAGITNLPGAFDFLYLNALSEKQVAYVLKQKCFIDVFHNPDKAFNTQAKSLAVLQLLHSQDCMEYLHDLRVFTAWYVEYCDENIY